MDLKNTNNIFDIQFLENFNEEIIDDILSGKNFRIERIVSTGQTSDWYDQEENELVILLQGIAKIEYEENVIKEVNVGDYFLIKAHEKHRVIYTSKNPACVWLCIFYK